MSEYSHRQIIRSRIVTERKLRVCYNGVNSSYYAGPQRSVISGSSPYSLFIGSAIPKKNVEGLLRAYSLLKPELRAAHPLLLRTSAMPSYIELATKLGILNNLCFINEHLSLEELVTLVAAAEVVILLSYDEGFGLPVAEAAAAGVSVLVADRGSLPEVTGCRQVCVDPDSPKAVARVWSRLLEDATFKAEVIGALRKSAERFKPARVCSHFMDILQESAG